MPQKLFSRSRLSLVFLFGACTGSVELIPVSCTFDAENVCSTCDYGTVYYCVCACQDGSIEYAHDEQNPCQSGTHCGGCPGQCLGQEQSFNCAPLEPDEPTTGPAYNCNFWDPDDLIASSGNDYSIDFSLVGGLLWDITPLYQCDSARVNVDSGLVIESAVSTDMAYLLGLRNGDVLIEVNGMALGDPLDAAAAYAELWLDEGETEYTLKVLRSSSYVYLDYTIVFTNP